MGKVVLDAATLARLGGLRDAVELYDEAGNLVGVCRPPARPVRSPFEPITEEEEREAFAAYDRGERGRPLADILADLRRL